eukprot:5138271-Alexandrium_andersonii.AAC.1
MRRAATAPPADGGLEHRRGGGRLAGRGGRVRTEGGRLLQRCRRRCRGVCVARVARGGVGAAKSAERALPL